MARFRTAVVVAALAAAGCTSEAAVPLEPLPTTVPASETTLPDGASAEVTGHINGEGVDLGLEFARQKCLENPALEEGVVQMADQVTGEVVAEFRQVCSEIRP